MKNPSKTLLISLIKLYQYLVRPLLGSHCRFYPSCSQYALEAVETHGPLKGCILTVKRLSKCHPFNPGGCDLVPDLKCPGRNKATG